MREWDSALGYQRLCPVGESPVTRRPSGQWGRSTVSRLGGRLSAPAGLPLMTTLRTLAVGLALAMVSVLALAVLPAPAHADDGANTSDTPVVIDGITNNITDTENLLGPNIGKVTDAISQVKKTTGVTLLLLYLPSFDPSLKPKDWAVQQLESMKPAKNTVFLAVASDEGSLVVVVSKNSDDWLKNRAAVNDFSKAANDPLTRTTPDWAGSAIALAHRIEQEKTDSQAGSGKKAVIIGLVVGFVLLAALAGWFFGTGRWSRQRTRRRHAQNSHVKSKGHKVLDDPMSSEKRTDDAGDVGIKGEPVSDVEFEASEELF